LGNLPEGLIYSADSLSRGRYLSNKFKSVQSFLDDKKAKKEDFPIGYFRVVKIQEKLIMEKKIRDVDTAMKYIILKPTKYHNEISLDYFGIQGLTLKKEDSELL